VLSSLAAGRGATFAAAARDFCRIQMMLSCWLAVGVAVLIPILIVPLFGERFAPAATLLPWFALLAVIKGGEVALYRLLYSVRLQSLYFRALAVGVAMIAALNVLLIPRIGVVGAVQAAVFSTCCVVAICAAGLARYVQWREFIGSVVRLAAALALTWAAVDVAGAMGAPAWLRAVIGCCMFPCSAALAGLIRNLNRSALFGRQHESLAAT